jgi:hypothetical protein
MNAAGQGKAVIHSVEETYDVVVCGGGLAGFCAAVAAARQGARVCLVHDRPVLGGNSSSEIRVPPQGAASYHAYGRETGIIHELLVEERAINHEPPGVDNGSTNSVWDMVLYNKAMQTPNLTVHLNSSVLGVAMKDERTVEAVTARVGQAETDLTIKGSVFIDCTGDGVVAALAGCEWRMGTESRDEFGEPHAPPQASDDVMGSSIHFRAKDTGRPVPFTAPDWAVRYDDPDFFYKQGRWPGNFRNGFWWLELSVPWHTIYDNEKLRHELTRHVLGIWDWIKNKDPELKIAAANYALDWIGQVPGKRESRRIIGEYFMTEHDPLRKTVFPDEVAYGGWFIDLHEPGGLLAKYSERSLVEGEKSDYSARSYVGPYGIPLRIMIAKGMNNLMMAGRNVSVTHVALGTVRVQGTTAVMGQAAGTAAAVAVRRGLSVRDVPDKAIREVQQILLREDCFLPNAVNEDPHDLARLAEASASSEAACRGAEAPMPNRDEADRLSRRRGQWVAVGGGRIDTLALCVTNDSDRVQPLEVKLYAVEHIWDYRVEPGEPLAAAVLKVAPGRLQWVEWPIGLDTTSLQGSYVRLDALANPHLIWHAAERVEPGQVSAYDMLNGQMRRFEKGLTMCFRVSPPQPCYGARQVLSGVSRPYRFTNLWRSDPTRPLPQHLVLSWREKVRVGRIELKLAGQLLRDYRSYPELYVDPQVARDLRAEALVDGEWKEIGAVTGNYQRRVVFQSDAPVSTDRIRITVTATNGDPSAAIYEVRCYER